MTKPGSNTLRAALQGFALASESRPHFGETLPDRAGNTVSVTPAGPSPAQVNLLREDLQRIVRSNAGYFNICVGALVILFAGACLFVYESLDDPKHIAAVFAGTGISVMAVVNQMIRVWKEKVNSDLLLTIVGSLTPAELKKVVDTLLKSQLKK